MNRPKCPKCGEPARYMHVTAPVIFELKDDGLRGKVVSVGEAASERLTYACGGYHQWSVLEVKS